MLSLTIKDHEKGTLDLQVFPLQHKSEILHFHLIKHVILSFMGTAFIKKMY